MKRIFLTILFLFLSSQAWAATWYARTDGGSSTQCDGHTDHALAGATGTNCAFNHPAWALGVNAGLGGAAGLMAAGDTLILKKGEYKQGFGMPNTGSICDGDHADCVMRPPPSGSDSSHKTKIYGEGYDSGCSGFETDGQMAQLWGAGGIFKLFTLENASNVELKCLEFTDHSSCLTNSPDDPCTSGEDYAVYGIYGKSSNNISLNHVWIHGLASRGMMTPSRGSWDTTDVTIERNGQGGWEHAEPPTDSALTGTTTLLRTKINWSGCGEAYPNTHIAQHCFTQLQGGYGDAVGIGDYSPGAWIVLYSEMSFNASDALDLLHGNVGDGSVIVSRSRFEGNVGQAIKIKASAIIENSMLLGNCTYWLDNPKASTTNIGFGGFDVCRPASPTVLGFTTGPGMNIYIYGNTIYGSTDTLIETSGTCDNSTKVHARNNLFIGATDWKAGSQDTADAFYTDGTGCAKFTILDEDYNVFWNTKNNSSACHGNHSTCSQTSPVFAQTIPTDFPWYQGTNFVDYFYLASGDTLARNQAIEGLTFQYGSNDYNNFDRVVSWDIGGLEYGSTGQCNNGVQDGDETGTDCGGNLCAACATCSDGIKNQNETAIDCGGVCTACPTCNDGIKNGTETAIDCGGTCSACPTCSDGVKNQNETDIDCGGVCTACPTCSDGILNHSETSIDCGGPNCPACVSCTDGKRNGTEIGVDCGGSCPTCAPTGFTGHLGGGIFRGAVIRR